ncbi:MAG: ABC transporter substrate-binding protein, partial [bacterium]
MGVARVRRIIVAVMLLMVLALPGAAQQAVVRVGVVVDITGGASSLGVPERDTVQLYQDELGTVKGPQGAVRIQYLITDGESDPTRAVIAVNRLIEEQRVVAVVCCTTSPGSLAILDTVQRARVPNVSLAAAVTIIEPVEERRWIFKTPQTDRLMLDFLTTYMRRVGHRRIAWLGFDDAFGQVGLGEFEKLAPAKGLEIVAREAFARAATDVTPQITRAAGRNPDAFLIWAIPPGANVATRNIRDLGLRQQVYQSHGVANRAFVDLGRDSVEGVIFPSGKVLIAETLPDSDKQKATLLEFARRFEARGGPCSRNTFGGHALDAMLILKPAIERVLKQGVLPDNIGGFRANLRDQ